MNSNISNKALVLEFWKKAISQGDLAFADKVIADNYIQHSAMAMAKPGKTGLLEALAFLKQMPKPENPPRPYIHVIADGAFVALHMLIEFAGRKQNVLDLVRIENGQVAEHWDAVQEANPNDNLIEVNPEAIGDQLLTDQNKKVVEKYFELFKNNRLNLLPEFLSEDFIQHPADGRNRMMTAKAPNTVKIEKTFRIIGEGNFVVAQSVGTVNNVPHVIYDIFLVVNKKIKEQWTVKQIIPEKMPHENGMI
jgi:predicted SnoaL-like aldol condensation-catalyzing enzyme